MSSPTALVSIIIPTYNRAHLIGETLDSVLAQTYTNWECIVVDDGSEDNTDDVVTAYVKNDARFQYHQRPKDRPKGANACRNYGFELSKGKYINWFDSDDLMLPNKLMLQVDQLMTSDLVMSVCQTTVFENHKKNILGLRNEKIHSKDFFNDFVTNDIKWLTQAPIIKRDFIIEKSIVFDEQLMQSQERDFFIKILNVIDDYLVCEEALVLFRKHGESISYGKVKEVHLQSNFRVNFNIIHNYHNRLTLKSVERLKKALKQCLLLSYRNGYHKLTEQLLKQILKNSIYFTFNEKTRLMVGFISLKIFKRGEFFFE